MGARAKDDADMDNVPESRTGKPQARSLLEASDSPAPGHPLALEGLAVVAGGSKGRPNPLQHSLISSASGPYRAWQPNAESPDRSPGRGSGGVGLLAVLLAAARPDQGVALAIRIIEQVGEDGRVEARIVELEGEVVPALVRLLRPGCPDLGTPDENPVAGGLVVGPVGLGNDADTLGLDAERHDLALIL